ncbi:biopolymer transporter ExbD [Spirosoma sp. KUDC1026]|uniref:biopolymer transporter ExbD n=1 Tax=Spirosoma sp. KUDC1026 TaxID=2745947 RepID=UPI00159BBB0D|nr:biopolymer transporter ExbD [Spirosoma sp. KUDC1026]QKZ12823.1 biopolymer transporter ExbD [Spirosoma sp. KUDC1026]
MRAARQRYKLHQVDMAPFVSVAMLLITFFIWMKQLERHKVVSVYRSPIGKAEYYLPLTGILFLLENNRIGYLLYGADSAASYVEIDYSTNGLQRTLRRTALLTNPILAIKPTSQSIIKNLVDVIDALAVNGQIDYMLADQLSGEEQDLLTTYRQYQQRYPQRPVVMKISDHR